MSGINVAILALMTLLVIYGAVISFKSSNSFPGFRSVSHSEVELFNLWQQWKITFKKSYPSQEEEQFRFQIFLNNTQLISAWNSLPNQTALLGLNQFADWTQKEYAEYSSDTFVPSKPTKPPKYLNVSNPLPTTVNWTAAGAVTPVANQGLCSSCWAFSVIGSVESLYYIENEALYAFSTQQLIDCSLSYGNNGCKSGQLGNAFQYVIHNGVETDKIYPYTGKQQVCQFDETEVIYTPDGYQNVPPYDWYQLMAAVSLQPVAIVVEADQVVFQFYRSGIISNGCGQAVNHGLLLVGYGYDDNLKMAYWTAKNFYGTTWGEQGYVRIQRSGTTNVCGVLTAPAYPYSH
jgi:Cysteine protease